MSVVIQGDKRNEWFNALDWQIKILDMDSNFNISSLLSTIDRLNIDRCGTKIKHGKFTYVLYYVCGDVQGYDIPILLNLDTGKSRLMCCSTMRKHKGARTTIRIAEELKNIQVRNIPNI